MYCTAACRRSAFLRANGCRLTSILPRGTVSAMNTKVMRRTFIAVVAMLGALGIAVQFWWPFQVTVAGKTWLSAHCYSSRLGWSTLSIVTSDPVKRARRDAGEGRFKLMLSPGHYDNKNAIKSHIFPGVRCNSAFAAQLAREEHYGDALMSACEAFHVQLRPCYTSAYNHQLIQNVNFPDKSCSAMEFQCPHVESPWNGETNQE